MAATGAPVATPRLSAYLYQSRMDVQDRKVQVKVRNEGDGRVEIESVTLLSLAYTEAMVSRDAGAILTPGTAVDLPVQLTEPVCEGPAGGQTALVNFRWEDRRTGTIEIPASDEDEAFKNLHERECFAAAVDDAASISIVGLPEIRPGNPLPARLTVEITASGTAEHELRIVKAGNTTLLQHADPVTGQHLPQGASVDVTAPSSGKRTSDITLVPGRCDAHALAEDKQGTRIPLLVSLNGREGTIAVVSPTPVTAALYEFVRKACQG